MRLRFITILISIAFVSQAQSMFKDSAAQYKNKLEVSFTSNFISSYEGLKWNGWGDGKFHTSIIGYKLSREVSPKLKVSLEFNYLLRISETIDWNKYPQNISMKGKNFIIGVGWFNKSILVSGLTTSFSANIGLQSVEEMNLVYYKPAYYEAFFETTGDNGLLVGANIGAEYIVLKRFSLGINSSYLRRYGFNEMEDYYKKTNRSYQKDFILVQPTIGFLF